MSDTPRCDDVRKGLRQFNVPLIEVTNTWEATARELERENAELRKGLEELLRMYLLEKRVQGHPCPENISTLSPMFDALERTEHKETA